MDPSTPGALDGGSIPGPAPVRPSRTTASAIFALAAMTIAAAAALSYLANAADLREQAEREISAIARSKVREVERWRDEWVADAESVAFDLAAEMTDGAHVSATLQRLELGLRSHHEYAALALAGPDGAVRFAYGDSPGELAEPSTTAFLRRALEERRALVLPIHRREGDSDLYLDVAAPMVSPEGRLLGAIVLRVNPHRLFFPMLESWPRPSETGETLLVTEEPGSAVVASELREGQPAARVEIPLSQAGDPAVRAAAGERGVVEAVDRRGRSVLAAIAPVPDSGWIVVVQMDFREAFAPLRARAGATAIVALALLLALGAGAALWRRAQVDAFERARSAADVERRFLARRLANLERWTNDAVIVGDAEQLRIVDVNARATRMLGYSRAELLGMQIADLRDPRTIGEFRARALQQAEEGGASWFETRYRRKDGLTFPVEVSVHEEHEGDRRLVHAIVRDVTERERAAEALHASEAKFRAAFEYASLGILILDPDGLIVETNRAFRRMLGYGDGELRGLSVTDLHEPGEKLAERVLGEMRAGSRETVDTPRRYRRKDGSVAETVLRATALRDDAGAVQFVLAVVEDVTERKRLEARLVFADRMASIGTLAAGVAHEINNPLAFILSNVDFALGAGQADPEVHRALGDARDGAVRVREIVRDLKAFSRSDDDQRVLLDPRQVLRAAVGVATNEIRHRAELVLDLGEVPAVYASEHRLGQVFLNLLINAAQAIPEGNALANRVRAATSTAPDGRALVEISDTGSGIAPDVLPRIFDPFFTTKPLGVGTGLGLSICHGIVSQAGGEIALESAPGKGSVFRVYLPAAPGLEPAPPGPAPAPHAPSPSTRRLRVLVVDDEALVGRAVARMLSPAHEVVVRTSGDAALDLLGRDPAFDVIVSDLMMPGTTGMDLHARVGESDPALAARMVFLTGGTFTEASREFLARVPNPWLAKPFDREALSEAVARASAPAEP